MFHEYPYTNLHELNLDWIISTIKRVEGEVDDFVAYNKITFAGTWDASKAYPAWSIVEDNSGNGYLSIKPVPVNVPLSDADHWQQISSYNALYTAFDSRITALENSTINGYSLPGNITLPYVPQSRKINGLALSQDRTLGADVIPYDNTLSGLTGDDVQEAIDEITNTINVITNNGAIRFNVFSIPGGSSVRMTGSGNSRGYILCTGASEHLMEIYSFYKTSYGLNVPQMLKYSGSHTNNLTFTVEDSAHFTVDNASAVTAFMIFIYSGASWSMTNI